MAATPATPPATSQSGGATAPDVFLNVPYDLEFRDLFLAYIAGLTCLGLSPRATVEISGSQRRLDRILSLIETCPYSVHDLSRVELTSRRPITPRFNMPFELGLTVACERFRREEHKWFVFEARRGRIEKSLSDLNGTDVYIHSGKPAVLFGELTNAFIRPRRDATVQEMEEVFRLLKKELPELMRGAGTKSCYKAKVFDDLRLLAQQLSNFYARKTGIRSPEQTDGGDA